MKRLTILLMLLASVAYADGYTGSSSRVKITDVNGDTVNITNGSLDISIQDQHTKAFDVYFSQVQTSASTLSVDAVIDAYTFEATAGHTITVGTQLVLYDSASDRLYVGEVLTAGATTITVDSPLSFSYPAATTSVYTSTKEMNVNGSVTRQTFSVAPPSATSTIDITRVMFQMTTTALPEMDKFGDITGGIDRGVMVRVVNGENVNLFNVKTNGELVNLMYDVNFYDTAKFGVYGLGGRLTYAGPSKHGVAIRLGPGDSMQAIVQDDLSTILSFRMIASGHIVE